MKKKTLKNLVTVILAFTLSMPMVFAFDLSHKAATSSNVITYARNLSLSIVDSSFRGSWVIDPENWNKVTENTGRTFDSLAKVKIGSTPKEVKLDLGSPNEVKNNGKIWVYGIKTTDGTYKGLLEVFFDDKLSSVIGIISFNPKNIVEKIGVNIGDTIDKIISAYGEPVSEKDFIEDQDNKEILGMYYLYPRSGIGFLIGQDKTSKNLLVHGILVYGKPQ